MSVAISWMVAVRRRWFRAKHSESQNNEAENIKDVDVHSDSITDLPTRRRSDLLSDLPRPLATTQTRTGPQLVSTLGQTPTYTVLEP